MEKTKTFKNIKKPNINEKQTTKTLRLFDQGPVDKQKKEHRENPITKITKATNIFFWSSPHDRVNEGNIVPDDSMKGIRTE